MQSMKIVERNEMKAYIYSSSLSFFLFLTLSSLFSLSLIFSLPHSLSLLFSPSIPLSSLPLSLSLSLSLSISLSLSLSLFHAKCVCACALEIERMCMCITGLVTPLCERVSEKRERDGKNEEQRRMCCDT